MIVSWAEDPRRFGKDAKGCTNHVCGGEEINMMESDGTIAVWTATRI